jgi:DNA-binding NarL/FixJ family response regulator
VIAIIDDHQLITASLSAALDGQGYSVVVPALTDVAQVTGQLTDVQPTVALLDLDLGGFGSGEDLLPVLLEMRTRVLMVSATDDDATIGRCLQAGAWGWVPKSSSLEVLLGALVKAAAGQPVLDEHTRADLIGVWRRRQASLAESLAPFERLSNREAVVLGLLVAGRSAERIATDSFVSIATIRTQIRAILLKLGTNSQLEAVALANQVGWHPPKVKEQG